MIALNKSLIYKQVPTGLPVPGQDLVVESRPIDLEQDLNGGVLVKNLYASFDPWQRLFMSPQETGVNTSDVQAFQLDAPVPAAVVARVERSDSPHFAVGDLITSYATGVIAEYAVVPAPYLSTYSAISNVHDLDLALFTGPLGVSGMTAFQGFYDVGKPQAGEIIFISSAAGAIGHVVGQLAKSEGLTVIGSAGSDEKVNLIVKELGFDAGFNYKKERPSDALARLAPHGIDLYFDNVGGDHLDAALDSLKMHGRIIGCGMMSEANTPVEEQRGLRKLQRLVSKRILFQGFSVDVSPEKSQAFQDKTQPMFAKGQLKAKLDITDGIEQAAEGFVRMLSGDKYGKAVLKIA